MRKPYFIMMYSQDMESAMPLLDGNEEDDEVVAFYETEEDAREVAEGHPFCSRFGYEIFCMGQGE